MGGEFVPMDWRLSCDAIPARELSDPWLPVLPATTERPFVPWFDVGFDVPSMFRGETATVSNADGLRDEVRS